MRFDGHSVALCVNGNGITPLKLASTRTGEVLIVCERRPGERALP